MFSALLMVVIFMAVGTNLAGQDDETKCCCSTYDVSVCLSKIHEKVDKSLNETYRQALQMTTRFGSTDVQNLKEAEKKWISYRDAACDAEYHLWGGGSGGPNAKTLCVIRLTRQRTLDLEGAYTKLNR